MAHDTALGVTMWCIWDEATDRRASHAAYYMRESVDTIIGFLKERQERGERVDVDASRLVAREISPIG